MALIRLNFVKMILDKQKRPSFLRAFFGGDNPRWLSLSFLLVANHISIKNITYRLSGFQGAGLFLKKAVS
jgi:hypothetical protein